MFYKDIYKTLSRTSFLSKMEYACQASANTMSMNGQIDANELVKMFLPEEIECFVLNSVVANEYNNREMNHKEFINVMNAIREYQPQNDKLNRQSEFLRWVLPTYGSVQFELQQNILCRLYRHYNLFSFTNDYVDVNNEFINKYEMKHMDYCSIVLVLHLLLAQKKYKEYNVCLENLIKKSPWFIKNLSIERNQYKEELRQFATDSSEYKFCLRPSYSYPFIRFEDKVVLPTPHLLVHSITSAMMNRLTYDKSDLREKIGKYAFENYIYKIVVDSNQFDEVFTEYEYEKGKRTLDILARKENTALLIDCKLFCPKVDLRVYDEDAYEKDLLRIIKDIKQAYKHVRELFKIKYYPFSVDINDVFALIIVYQDAYISQNDIYSRTAKELCIDESSDDYIWLISHIGLADVASLERYLLNKVELLPDIINRGELTDKWLINIIKGELTDEVICFKNKLLEENRELLKDLLSK